MSKDLVRYRTAGGAIVTVTVKGDRGEWECAGCGADSGLRTWDDKARAGGQDHASSCRALPDED